MHRISESFTLEKALNIIKSNCKLNTAKFTRRSNQMTTLLQVLFTVQLEVMLVKIRVKTSTMPPF